MSGYSGSSRQFEPNRQQNAAVLFSALGVIATLTVPVGKRYVNVRAMVMRLGTVGTPSVKSFVTPSGGVKQFTSPAIGMVADNCYWLPQSAGGAGMTETLGMTMQAGDVFGVEVTALVAGTTGDIMFYWEESL